MMQRRIGALAGAMAILASVAPMATAQDEAAGSGGVLFCATVSGTPPSGTWTAEELQAAIVAGEATLGSFAVPATCQADPPRPIEVVDKYMSTLGDSVSFLVIVANPNTGDVAVSMPIRVDALDKKDQRVGFEYARLFLLPGQTGAIHGVMTGAQGARKLAVIPATHDSNYLRDFPADGHLELTKVKTTVEEFEGPRRRAGSAASPLMPSG